MSPGWELQREEQRKLLHGPSYSVIFPKSSLLHRLLTIKGRSFFPPIFITEGAWAANQEARALCRHINQLKSNHFTLEARLLSDFRRLLLISSLKETFLLAWKSGDKRAVWWKKGKFLVARRAQVLFRATREVCDWGQAWCTSWGLAQRSAAHPCGTMAGRGLCGHGQELAQGFVLVSLRPFAAHHWDMFFPALSLVPWMEAQARSPSWGWAAAPTSQGFIFGLSTERNGERKDHFKTFFGVYLIFIVHKEGPEIKGWPEPTFLCYHFLDTCSYPFNNATFCSWFLPDYGEQ